MQRACRKFLARPRRADDQDSAIGLGGPLNGLAQLIHAGGASGQHARCRRELLEFLHFAFQTGGFQRPGRYQNEAVRLEGLFDEVVRAALDRCDCSLDVAVSGNHHHRYLGVIPLYLLQQLQSIELAALQPDVEKHQIRTSIGDFSQRRIAVARGPGGETLVFKNPGNQIPNICFVVDNQNVICHGSRLSCQLPVAASIFASLLVAFAGSTVPDAGCLVSRACSFTSGACCVASDFGAWPDIANRNRIQAPRASGRMSAASLSSIRPPWSSSTRPTIARPSPVPFSRVVT